MDDSLRSETAIVFSFPGRAEALPGVGCCWEIGDFCRKSGQNQRFTGQSEKRPVSGLSTQRTVPAFPFRLCFVNRSYIVCYDNHSANERKRRDLGLFFLFVYEMMSFDCEGSKSREIVQSVGGVR